MFTLQKSETVHSDIHFSSWNFKGIFAGHVKPCFREYDIRSYDVWHHIIKSDIRCSFICFFQFCDFVEGLEPP